METKINYWVVGASFDIEDMYQEFIENNFWYMGWDEESKENPRVKEFFERISKIKLGDRIAIKRMLGPSQSDNIKIMAIGIVKKIVKNDIVFIDWIVKDMNRHVPIKGCIGTIYGPFDYQDNWTKEVFCI